MTPFETTTLDANKLRNVSLALCNLIEETNMPGLYDLQRILTQGIGSDEFHLGEIIESIRSHKGEDAVYPIICGRNCLFEFLIENKDSEIFEDLFDLYHLLDYHLTREIA